MAQVSITVNGRAFAVSCEDGQEMRTRRLAQYVEMKAGEFSRRLGQVGEAQLLLLAALVIADELADSNAALEEERRQARGEVEAAASRVDGLARRIETIAARLEAP